jgi:hypothetical protein
MGWANCGTDDLGRPIGYAHSAICDYGYRDATKRRCLTNIHRGLSFVCGAMHGGGEYGCGRYFCTEHLTMIDVPDALQIHKRVRTTIINVCEACAEEYEHGRSGASDEIDPPGTYDSSEHATS